MGYKEFAKKEIRSLLIVLSIFVVFLLGLCMVSSALAFDQNLFCANLGLDFSECSWAMSYIQNNSVYADPVNCTTTEVVVEQCNASDVIEGLNFSCPVCECSDLPVDYDHVMWLLNQKGMNFTSIVDVALNPVECDSPAPCPVCGECADCTKVLDKYKCESNGGSWDDGSCNNINPKVINTDPVTGATVIASYEPEKYSNGKNRGLSSFIFYGFIALGLGFAFFKWGKPYLRKRKSIKDHGTPSRYDHENPESVRVRSDIPQGVHDYKKTLEQFKNKKNSKNKPVNKVVEHKRDVEQVCPKCDTKLVFDKQYQEFYCSKCNWYEMKDEQ